MNKPRRHWFRFSLRTMLVLATLVCVVSGYVGWAMNWIRHRESFENQEGVLLFILSDCEMSSSPPRPITRNPPWQLWIFGERGVFVINVSSPSLVNEAKRWFPEARIELFEE